MDIIIGGGVSGISYAKFSNSKCLILEKESELGGYCRTIKRNGYVWDYSGHFFHFQNKDIESIVCQNIEKNSLLSVNKDTSIYYNGTLIDFPFQKNIHQLDKDEFIDCLYDLFAANPNVPVNSFKEMIISNLGNSICKKFLIPYNEKLYACDLDSLDSNAMGRFFPKANKEEIVLNFRNNNLLSYNQTFIYPKGGAIEYINSLLFGISNLEISLTEEVLSIDVDRKIVLTNTREIKYDNLISTIPFPVLLDKCGLTYDKDIFTCNKVLVFNLGFDRKGSNDHTSWLYIPNKDFVFYRVGYYDNIMQTDKLSLYVEIGFSEDEVLDSIDTYLERVLSDLKQCGIINDEVLVDYESVLMNPAYVHINSKSESNVSYFKSKLANHDIYSIGRYGSWTYCSIEDNIIEARNLANKLGNI